MGDFYQVKQVIIGEDGWDYRWVISNAYEGKDGINIEYQELDKDAGEWKTKHSVGFYDEPAKLIIQALNELSHVDH